MNRSNNIFYLNISFSLIALVLNSIILFSLLSKKIGEFASSGVTSETATTTLFTVTNTVPMLYTANTGECVELKIIGSTATEKLCKDN